MTKRNPAPPAPAPEGLRDQIAIRAMEIIIGGNAATFMEHVSVAPKESFQNVARISFGLADAMIEARGR
jgi:hypothetical protein